MAFSSFWFGSSKEYATLNPDSATNSADMTLSEGNLRVATTTNSRTLTATMAMATSGGFYFEIKAISYATDGGVYLGLTSQAINNNAFAVSYLGFDTYAGTYRTPSADDTNNFSGTNVTGGGTGIVKVSGLPFASGLVGSDFNVVVPFKGSGKTIPLSGIVIAVGNQANFSPPPGGI